MQYIISKPMQAQLKGYHKQLDKVVHVFCSHPSPLPTQPCLTNHPSALFQIFSCLQFDRIMVNNKAQEHKYLDVNYLTSLKAPPVTEEHMYDHSAGPKSDFTYIKGIESHLIRRKMILTKYPQIAKLLVPDKPWTIIIAFGVILLSMANCYWARDHNIWLLLINAYLVGGLLNHTLHCCIHDFTHFGGHRDMNVNKIMAVLCNIPMAIPSALSFGKYHSDHHNFLGEELGDPDLPLMWESKLSYQHKWYKYLFYLIIELFYALRPIFMKNPSLSRDEALNYVFIFFTNYLVYAAWGPYALLFLLVAGLSSIGPHPAAIHIIAEHYEFIEGQQTYDYIGFWNIFNLDLGYHLEHHDFPNAPWYNLREIRRIAPEFYEYLPYHTSYWKVIKKFLSDVDFNLFFRTIRVPPKTQ